MRTHEQYMESADRKSVLTLMPGWRFETADGQLKHTTYILDLNLEHQTEEHT